MAAPVPVHERARSKSSIRSSVASSPTERRIRLSEMPKALTNVLEIVVSGASLGRESGRLKDGHAHGALDQWLRFTRMNQFCIKLLLFLIHPPLTGIL